jgi:hypothetical protein
MSIVCGAQVQLMEDCMMGCFSQTSPNESLSSPSNLLLAHLLLPVPHIPLFDWNTCLARLNGEVFFWEGMSDGAQFFWELWSYRFYHWIWKADGRMSKSKYTCNR